MTWSVGHPSIEQNSGLILLLVSFACLVLYVMDAPTGGSKNCSVGLKTRFVHTHLFSLTFRNPTS